MKLETYKKLFIALCLLTLIVGIVYAASPYIWSSEEITVTEDITISGSLSGTALIVGDFLTVTVTITNPTGALVSGTLLVEMWTSDEASMVEELFNGIIDVLTTEDFVGNYDWTAILGTYKAKATFTV